MARRFQARRTERPQSGRCLRARNCGVCDIAARLYGEEAAVFAAGGHQLRMRAVFDDAAVLKHENLRRRRRAGQPVRDEDRRFAFAERVELVIDLLLGDRVERGRRFV